MLLCAGICGQGHDVHNVVLQQRSTQYRRFGAAWPRLGQARLSALTGGVAGLRQGQLQHQRAGIVCAAARSAQPLGCVRRRRSAPTCYPTHYVQPAGGPCHPYRHLHAACLGASRSGQPGERPAVTCGANSWLWPFSSRKKSAVPEKRSCPLACAPSRDSDGRLPRGLPVLRRGRTLAASHILCALGVQQACGRARGACSSCLRAVCTMLLCRPGVVGTSETRQRCKQLPVMTGERDPERSAGITAFGGGSRAGHCIIHCKYRGGFCLVPAAARRAAHRQPSSSSSCTRGCFSPCCCDLQDQHNLESWSSHLVCWPHRWLRLQAVCAAAAPTAPASPAQPRGQPAQLGRHIPRAGCIRAAAAACYQASRTRRLRCPRRRRPRQRNRRRRPTAICTGRTSGH